ncbi:MAG: ABC transporter permease [Bacteroidota bacterium]
MVHFLKNTLRIFRRNAVYTFINLTGLSIGLAAGILILLYVFNELSYDRFHRNGNDIYRVNMIFTNPDGSFPSYTIPAAVGPSLATNFPVIRSMARITMPSDGYFTQGETNTEISNVCYADSSFFDIFSFRLIRGNQSDVLNGPGRIVLTLSAARALFGNKDPMGQVLRYNSGGQFTVTGIAEDPPSNSSIQFNALLSFTTLYQDKSLYMDWNGGNQYITYLLTGPGFDINSLEPQLVPFLEEKINRDVRSSGGQYTLRFEPMFDIYLHPFYDDGSGGSMSNIRIFSVIALLIILIACFNFTSLSTAKAMRRSRETGIRKVSGASAPMLIRQFLGEAVLMSFLAMLLALLIIELVQPWYNAVTGLSLSLYSINTLWLAGAVLLLVLSTGIIAGAYPAVFLASFNPVTVLKGGTGSVKTRSLIPKILVVLQFAISAGLINCSLVIYSQLNYIRHFNPGFRSGDVLALSLPDEEARRKHEIIGSELLSIPGVRSWTAVSEPPGAGVTSNGYLPDGYKDVVMINVMDTDTGFIHTLGLELVAGRNFESGFPADSNAFLVNQTFASRFGMKNPGAYYVKRDGKHPVIGVVRDFHFNSLHGPVEPLILTMKPWGGYSNLLIHVNAGEKDAIRQQIETRWRKLLPGTPFVCTPLDVLVAGNYSKEKSFAGLFNGFTLLAIVVACLGLFGLSAIILQQRRRELGIRRIMGAGPWSLLLRLTYGYTLLVFIANLIAAIPVWFIMKTWLANFSFGIHLSVISFLITALFTLLLAWMTILWQSWQTARLNPAEVVRYE